MMDYPPIEQSFSLPFKYALHFTEALFSPSNSLFASVTEGGSRDNPSRVLFVIDSGVDTAHPALRDDIIAYCGQQQVLKCTEILVVPGGEASKNDRHSVDRVLEAINKQHICRHSFVIAIGGGAVIDMVGYAAAIAHRGVKLIRVPTTVLSQNDAAVGVKNGINHFGKKNFIGTFAPPYAIINDRQFLTTLDPRDWISGVSEAVKVALIKDGDFFEELEKVAGSLVERDMDNMMKVIYRCARIHMEHIALGGDPFEKGSSRPLDFGHWAAHKLEQMTQYKLRHGEAVAKGMALDVTYAHLNGLIDEAVYSRILKLLARLGFDLQIPLKTKQAMEQLLQGIEEFREHLGGQLTITLIDRIGHKKDVHEINLETMRKSVRLLNERCQINVA